jgi:hypothetical protein
MQDPRFAAVQRPRSAARMLRLRPHLPGTWTGVALFGTMMLGFPLTNTSLAQVEALNRELGKLCSNPPRQALTVCRIHARLVNAL